MGTQAVELGTDIVVAVGAGAAMVAEGAREAAVRANDGSPLDPQVYAVGDAQAAYALLAAKVRPGDVVLVKSSNAAGLRFLGDRVAGREVGS